MADSTSKPTPPAGSPAAQSPKSASSSYTASLSSSVVDYPTEHGRRYHSFRSGSYILPNDESEMDRLDFCHALLTKTIGNKLFLAPIDEKRLNRILDVGTGTGIWAIEMGDKYPNAEILGNDLSAIQPAWIPPNVKFEIDDVESEWIGEKYDFIFSRYMCGSIADWPKYVKRVYDNLNPGGWAEFQDWSFMIYSDDGTIEGTELLRWVDLFMDACKVFGRDGQIGPKLEGIVRENTTFVNVHHQPYKIPAGPWAKDPHLKDIGMLELIQLLDGLEGFSLRLLCGALGWTKEEVLVLLAGVRKDLKNPNIHAWLYYNVVYGQKPEKEEE
ncbi:methyltransferase domain-containing protein [Colletotrichum salicis]|uniref:Methyltransferase domain-containing protein n=1 Tax=Colletotrichum salicis TaxID=1209931 RepID=A0A135TUU3_9PEZI|nr:methyltransferase domain-containing protein [Colletotrichum salicis]